MQTTRVALGGRGLEKRSRAGRSGSLEDSFYFENFEQTYDVFLRAYFRFGISVL